MTICEHCQKENCTPMWFTLCPGCRGESCDACRDALVPGIVQRDGEDDLENNIRVCSQFGDSEVDAIESDTMQSFIKALTEARDNLMSSEEELL